MNPAQLLNPKAFAKEQAKNKKRTPNYGPKQSRKPANPSLDGASAQVPTYDPKALLNPKTSGTNGVATTSKPTATDDNLGATSMIERLHNITERDDAPAKKRKIMIAEEDDQGDEQQKGNGEFNHFGNGGIIGNHLKEERKEIAAKAETSQSTSTSNTIDLTGDDDDEVQIVADSAVRDVRDKMIREDPNEEVCLGMVRSSINAHRIPSANSHLGKEWWPPTKVTTRREIGKNTIIEALDNQGNTFGTLESRAAAGLCPLLDGSAHSKIRMIFRLEQRRRQQGEHIGLRVSQNLKAHVLLFSPRRLRNSIGTYLSQKQLFLVDPPYNPGRPVENPHVPQIYNKLPKARPQQGQQSFVQRTAEEMRHEANTMFDSLAKAEDLPQMEANNSIILTPLMAHQKQALNFMMQHERSDYDGIEENPPHSLWKYEHKRDGRHSWIHIITSEVVQEKPALVQGGILADVMGLGKTLSILSLIAETHEASKAFRSQEPPLNLENVVVNARATLIVCPKSVLANWQEQVVQHTELRKLEIYTYHGSSRLQDVRALSKYDIVITSYSTAAAEFSDAYHKKRALASINWFRIVLDEAHSIRNVSAKVSKACCALEAERRWAVTGTPLQNRLDDLGSLMKFLRIKPFDDSAKWAKHIMSPLKLGQEQAMDHLKLLMNTITLRRVKETVGLKDRREERVRLEFSDSERALYEAFAKRVATQFHTMTQGQNVLRGKAYAHVLKSLSRLRSICAHGREMLSEDDMKDIEGFSASNAIVLDIGDEPGLENEDDFISGKQAYETFDMMEDTEVDRCINCDKKLGGKKGGRGAAKTSSGGEEEESSGEDDGDNDDSDAEDDLFGYLTTCYHLLCTQCKEKHQAEVAQDLTADNYYPCPHCGQYKRSGQFPLRRSGLKHFNQDRIDALNRPKAARWDENTYSGPHTKVKALLHDLKLSEAETAALPPGEPPIRSVVFSGWTTYLDLIEFALGKDGIGFVRLDGTMSLRARARVLDTFKSDPAITVLLVSIKAGGQGLNFTAANKVYVMEPQFNPGVEQQAVDRVHRLGQTRDVHIVHYIMTNSVEEGILKLQRKKEDLARMSLERKMTKSEEAKKRLEELRELFK